MTELLIDLVSYGISAVIALGLFVAAVLLPVKVKERFKRPVGRVIPLSALKQGVRRTA